jgi:glutamyl-tRNA reductase
VATPERPAPVSLLLVGTNHRHAPIGVRERLAARDHGRELVEDLMLHDAVAEAVGLSTCNRCELYLIGSDAEAMRTAAVQRLAAYSRHGIDELDPMLYVRHGIEVAEHLFAVAGGLDSLVPGEAQILSQIRGAYAGAAEVGSTGPVANRLFHEAIEAGKRIRHETAIGEGGASVASVAAELARERLGGLEGATALVIGAGKIAELVASNLAARGASMILVANRDRDKAVALASRFGGEAVSLDSLAAAVGRADVVVSSTSSAEPVLRAADVPAGRRVLIDLALPRDIEPGAAAIEGVTLVDIDQLEGTVRRNIALREGEAGRAREIVAEQAEEFRSWLAALEVVPAITSLRALAEQIRVAELERAEGRWESLSDADRQRLDALTRSMLGKLLHRPTVRLKELAAEHESEQYTQVVTELFGL